VFKTPTRNKKTKDKNQAQTHSLRGTNKQTGFRRAETRRKKGQEWKQTVLKAKKRKTAKAAD